MAPTMLMKVTLATEKKCPMITQVRTNMINIVAARSLQMKNTGTRYAMNMVKSTVMNTCKQMLHIVSKVMMESTDLTQISILRLIMVKRITTMKNTGRRYAMNMVKSTMMSKCKQIFRIVSKMKMESTNMTPITIGLIRAIKITMLMVIPLILSPIAMVKPNIWCEVTVREMIK